jgi:hypothetical protein
MYGLPQAEIIAQELLADRLQNHGYTQSKTTPGLWLHKLRPIQFSLVVDDFGVKYVGKENAEHLLNTIRKYYVFVQLGRKKKLWTYHQMGLRGPKSASVNAEIYQKGTPVFPASPPP